MQDISFEEGLEKICAGDQRYPLDAYKFVREALDHTQKAAGKNRTGRQSHVSCEELLEGIRDFALAQFGPMAITVLDEWRIRRCEDFGEIVFNMIEHKLLAKTDKDSRKLFSGGYSFEDAFRRPFLPSDRQTPKPRSTSPLPDVTL
jgi:uncharacterized repeat protein (TIGR04138 family)